MLLSEAIPLTSQAVLAATTVPPKAARKPKAMTKFGDRRVDPYFWLRDKASPEVIDYLHAENRYTEGVMKPLASFRDSLYKEILARVKETDESVPYRHHGYWYYQREVEGLQYPIYCRRKGTMEAETQAAVENRLRQQQLNRRSVIALGRLFLRASPTTSLLRTGRAMERRRARSPTRC